MTAEQTGVAGLNSDYFEEPPLTDPIKDPCEKVRAFIEQLSEGRPSGDWLKYRLMDLDKNGENSLMNMLPTTINKNTHFLVRFFHSLERGKINTKDKLLNADLIYINKLDQMGPKGFNFAKILREALRAEKDSKSEAL